MFKIRFIRIVEFGNWSIIRGIRMLNYQQITKYILGGNPSEKYDWLIIFIWLSSTISCHWNKDWSWMAWSFMVTIRLLNQIQNWVRRIIRYFINPFDLFTFFGGMMAFLKLTTTFISYFELSNIVTSQYFGTPTATHNISRHVKKSSKSAKLSGKK